MESKKKERKLQKKQEKIILIEWGLTEEKNKMTKIRNELAGMREEAHQRAAPASPAAKASPIQQQEAA
jgi:hypothetical protein